MPTASRRQTQRNLNGDNSSVQVEENTTGGPNTEHFSGDQRQAFTHNIANGSQKSSQVERDKPNGCIPNTSTPNPSHGGRKSQGGRKSTSDPKAKLNIPQPTIHTFFLKTSFSGRKSLKKERKSAAPSGDGTEPSVQTSTPKTGRGGHRSSQVNRKEAEGFETGSEASRLSAPRTSTPKSARGGRKSAGVKRNSTGVLESDTLLKNRLQTSTPNNLGDLESSKVGSSRAENSAISFRTSQGPLFHTFATKNRRNGRKPVGTELDSTRVYEIDSLSESGPTNSTSRSTRGGRKSTGSARIGTRVSEIESVSKYHHHRSTPKETSKSARKSMKMKNDVVSTESPLRNTLRTFTPSMVNGKSTQTQMERQDAQDRPKPQQNSATSTDSMKSTALNFSNYPWNNNPIAVAIWVAQKIENAKNVRSPQATSLLPSRASSRTTTPLRSQSRRESNENRNLDLVTDMTREDHVTRKLRQPDVNLLRSNAQSGENEARNLDMNSGADIHTSRIDRVYSDSFDKLMDQQAEKIAPKIKNLKPFNLGFADAYFDAKAKELRLNADTVAAGKLLANVLPALLGPEERVKCQRATDALIRVLDQEASDSPRFSEALDILSRDPEVMQGARAITAQVYASEVLLDFDGGNQKSGLGLDGQMDSEPGVQTPSPRTSGRLRKPTARALESQQQKPKARKPRASSSKVQSLTSGAIEANATSEENPQASTTIASHQRSDTATIAELGASTELTEPSVPHSFSTEEEFIASQLFELAAAAVAPDFRPASDEDLSVERLREEYYASRRLAAPGGPSEDGSGSGEAESAVNPAQNAREPGPAPALDHPNIPRPWTDEDGWTHTGRVNDHGEEIVLVPDTYVWVRPANVYGNCGLPLPPPRLKSREQTEKDRIFGFPPPIGQRNLPRGEPRPFVPEDVGVETAKIKAREEAAKRGITVDRSMSLAELEAKIQEHDNPGSSRRKKRGLAQVAPAESDAGQNNADTPAAGSRKRRRTETTAVEAVEGRKTAQGSRNRSLDVVAGNNLEESSPAEERPRKKRRSTAKPSELADEKASGKQKRRSLDEVERGAARNSQDANVTGGSARKKRLHSAVEQPDGVESAAAGTEENGKEAVAATADQEETPEQDNSGVTESPGPGGRPRRRAAAALLAQLQSQAEARARKASSRKRPSNAASGDQASGGAEAEGEGAHGDEAQTMEPCDGA